MSFTRIQPHPDLAQLIDCYWIVTGDDAETRVEKIIPDGFTELIFHYGDAYRTDISGSWQIQPPHLLAGQISSFFSLENTGQSIIVAIKMQPAGLTQLFGLQMSDYTNQIFGLDAIPNHNIARLRQLLPPTADEQALKLVFDGFFLPLSKSVTANPVNTAVNHIFERNGMVTVKELTDIAGVGERQLERLFKRYVGLSPKFYARVIRFNYIFEIIKNKSLPWADVVYQAGYYDQSHFIRNFKAFTGEDPSAYYFDEDNMANFFLNK
ncbi:MAG: helix-turn-helix domain-containing protein [Bacteroidota bacterium]